MTATFTVDAFPYEVFTGKVVQIRHDAIHMGSAVLYTVVITFDNSDLKLLPYMTANLKFEIDKVQNPPKPSPSNPATEEDKTSIPPEPE